jgi:hypothetical protein
MLKTNSLSLIQIIQRFESPYGWKRKLCSKFCSLASSSSPSVTQVTQAVPHFSSCSALQTCPTGLPCKLVPQASVQPHRLASQASVQPHTSDSTSSSLCSRWISPSGLPLRLVPQASVQPRILSRLSCKLQFSLTGLSRKLQFSPAGFVPQALVLER